MPTPQPLATSAACAGWLGELRDRFRLPAAASADFDRDTGENLCVAGNRRSDHPGQAGPDDLWHFGSVGKAITSAALATLVADGVLDWQMRVSDGLGLRAGSVRGDIGAITLAQLLSHRAGLPTNPPLRCLLAYILLGGSAERASDRMVDRALGRRPLFAPGSDFLYSNLGYGLAGLMASRVSGQPFQRLVRERVLEPAGMLTASFGIVPQTGLHPLEHGWSFLRRRYVPNRQSGRAVDDLPVMQPSGCIHGRIHDLMAFGRFQLRAAASDGRSELAIASTHDPIGPPPEPSKQWRYGMGWIVEDHASPTGLAAAASGPALPLIWHNGSTGGCFAALLLDRSRGRGLAFVANAFSPQWSSPGTPLIAELLRRLSDAAG